MSSAIRRILVLRTGHIGDVVLLTPALGLLNRLFPGAEISALVRAGTEPVLRHHPLVKEIYTGGEIVGQQRMFTQKKTSLWRRLQQVPRGLKVIRALRRQRFDLAIDFTGGDRTALFAFFSGATRRVAHSAHGSGFVGRDRLFTRVCLRPLRREHKVWKDVELLRTVAATVGVEWNDRELVPGPTVMRCSAEDVSWARDYWSRLGTTNGPRVLIHPTSRVSYKCWAAEKWIGVIDRLATEARAQALITSGPDPREMALAETITRSAPRAAACLGNLTIGQLAALLQQANLFLGVDTAPMHLATAVGTRVVGVFGPSENEVWGPWGTGHCVVRRPCPCLESRQRGCDEATGMKCLNELTVDEVWQAAQRALRQK